VESERLAGLYEKALNLFEGDTVAARTWLGSPKRALGGSVPLSLAETEVGARAVEELIGRLDNGAYS
jgi:putative toxin-antitoxin system antitoxin component (TIGR02293 family)